MGIWSTICDAFMEGVNETRREQIAPEKVEDFNGTNEMYAAKMNRYLYEDRDWYKAYKFEAFLLEKYPGRRFENESSMCILAWVLYNGYQVSQLGLVQHIRILGSEPCEDNEPFDLNDVLKYIAALVSMGVVVDTFGLANYHVCQFVYQYMNDLERLEELSNKYEDADYDDAIKLEREIDEITNFYNGWIGFYPYYVQRVIELADIDHLSNNIQQSAEKLCGFMDEVYTHVLNNAIRLHNAVYLKSLYPTESQKRNVRSYIQQEILNTMNSGVRNIEPYNRYANQCLKICSRMYELNDQNASGSIMAKGALSLAMGFISGPLGIATGVREGYNVYSREMDLDRLENLLEEVFKKMLEEYVVLCDSLNKSADCLEENLIQKICSTYLFAAINDIFNKIKHNGGRLYKLEEYFK